MKQVMQFLGGYKRGKKSLITCIILQFILSVVALITPEVFRQGTKAIENQNLDALWSTAILAVVATVVNVVLAFWVKILRRDSSLKYEEDIQTKLISIIIDIKKIRFSKLRSGDIVTNVINNVSDAVGCSIECLFGIFTGLAVIIFCTVYMGVIDYKIMLAILAFNVVIRMLMAFFEKKIKTYAKKVVAVTKKNNSFMFDMLNNMMTIKSFAKKLYFNTKLEEKENETLRLNFKLSLWGGANFEFIWTSMKVMEYAVLYGFGGYLVYKGYTELATVFAFTLVVEAMVGGINTFTGGINGKNKAAAHIESLNETLDIKEIEDEPLKNIKDNQFVIKAENLGFSFGDNVILDNINFTIKENEKIMITGPNGKGKSTLLNLISGLYRPGLGKLYYGDNDISVINLNNLAEKYGYISQNSNILDGNVFENFSLLRKYNEKKCNDVLDKLNMPNIKDTSPSSLSQGEKQRLNIGRVLYKSDKISLVIGDEIFANVDKENSKKICEYMSKEFKDKTVIMVCHEKIDFPFDRVFHVDNTTLTDVTEGSVGV